MTELVKQRMVGFAVLLLMMGVIVPWVLDHAEAAPDNKYAASTRVSTPVAVAKQPRLHHAKAKSSNKAKKHSVSHVLTEPLELHQRTKVMQIAQEDVVRPFAQDAGDAKASKRALRQTSPKLLWYRDNHARWVAQVASFSSVFNARKQIVSLTRAGLPSKMRRTVVNGHDVYRVFVGPFSHKSVAERIISRWRGHQGKMLVT